jgi:hypothetical protein
MKAKLRYSVNVLFTIAVVCIVLAGGTSNVAHGSVLLIASSWDRGLGPFSSDIQTPLTNAGITVRVWAQATLGWPPLDTMRAYDAVFFHGSERYTMGRGIDTLLTQYVEEGGRLIVEGTMCAQWASVYHDFYQHAYHAKWLERDVPVAGFNQSVVDAAHPIARGLPATIPTSGFMPGRAPNMTVACYGGRRIIAYQDSGGSASVIAYPRSVFISGSVHRITTQTVRDSLIIHAVQWILTDPRDVAVYGLDYELGHRSGQEIPVNVTLRHWGGQTDTGELVVEVSIDSSNWTAIDSTDYTMSSPDPSTYILHWTPGFPSKYFLRATIRPSTPDYQVDNNVRGVFVSTLQQAVHPHMFFHAGDIPGMQNRATTTQADFAQALATSVNTNLSYNPPAASQWRTVNYGTFGVMLWNDAFQAVLNHSPTYVNNAINKCMALCRYPMWDPPTVNQEIYSGLCCVAVACTFDWLYDDFTPAQRDTVQIKLKTQLERLDAMYPQLYWVYNAYHHNHHWNDISLLGIGAFALMDEEPAAAKWEQRSITSLDNRFYYYGAVTDGSWYESMNYWGSITSTLLPHLWLLRDQMNINYFDRPFVQSLANYRIYGSLPAVNVMMMENTSQPGEWWGPDEQLSLLAREYRDGHAQWLRRQVINANGGFALSDPLDFIFYDPTVAEETPTLLSRSIPDQDEYFARSDWSPDATFFHIKCGVPTGRHSWTTQYTVGGPASYPVYSHFHPDQNNFSIYYRNHYLIQTGGIQYPLAHTYNANTVLVNGHGQIGDSTTTTWTLPVAPLAMNPHLGITYGTDKLDYVMGDATTSYDPMYGVRMFNRHILFIRPNMFVILDRLKSATASTFSFVLRNPSNIFSWNTQRVLLSEGTAQLSMKVLEPQPWAATSAFNNLYFTQWGGWGLYLTNSTPDTSVRFLNVVYPADGGEATVSERVCNDNYSAIRLRDTHGWQAYAFLKYSNVDSATFDTMRTDGQMAVVAWDSARAGYDFMSVKDCQMLRFGTGLPVRFLADQPTNLEWAYQGTTLALNGRISSPTQIWAPTATVVTYNGGVLPFTRTGDYITLGTGEGVPRPPEGLTVYGVPEGVRLIWKPVTTDISDQPIQIGNYDIYRGIRIDSAYTQFATVPGNVTTYTDTETPVASPITRFYYVVARAASSPSAPAFVPPIKKVEAATLKSKAAGSGRSN